MSETQAPRMPRADCGHEYTPPGPQGGAAGYATSRETGKTSCYPCADEAAKQEIRDSKHGEPAFFLYYKDSGEVTTWTGGHLGTIVHWGARGGFGGGYRSVRAILCDGRLWAGRAAMINGTYVRLRLMRQGKGR